MAKKKKAVYSLPVRLTALILTVLVTSGILAYLVMFLISLFA